MTPTANVINIPAVAATAKDGSGPMRDANPQELVEPHGDRAAGVTPEHDIGMAAEFLACLDPNADRFTFQFFSDGPKKFAEIFHGTLDDVWPKVRTLNTVSRRIGVFVTVNETDLSGRRTENIVRPRALFVDADTPKQIRTCTEKIAACDATPSIAVKSGRGLHCYWPSSDIPLDQFSSLQREMIAQLGTDPAINDLPRVMRLPGTLHLKDETNPRLVKLCKTNAPLRHWNVSELATKFGLSRAEPARTNNVLAFNHVPEWAAKGRPSTVFADLPAQSLADGLEPNIEEIRSAVDVIPPSAIETESGWTKFARALAHTAAIFNKLQEPLYEILDTASRPAPGYNEPENRTRWLRYIGEAYVREKPITIASVFDLAKKHGWRGWSPSGATENPSEATAGSTASPPPELKVSFSNIPHRQWLYGVDLVRGDITLLASPGGAGKTSLALGMAICLVTGKAVLGERIWGSGPFKSLYVNAEDGGAEMLRRACAFCQQHKISEHELDRLYMVGADDLKVQGISFLRASGTSSATLNQAGFAQLESLVASRTPDLIILDPMIALCGGGDLNNNAVMALVQRELKKVGIKYNCAILIVLHTSKGGDRASADAISGASAIKDLARRAIMPVTMTEVEAKAYSLLPSERLQYFKLVDAKSNLAPRSGEAWYKLENQELPNAEPPTYPHGDRVQAVVRVDLKSPKSTSKGDPKQQRIRFELLKLIEQGIEIDGETAPYSPNSTGKNKMRAILDEAMDAVKRVSVGQEYAPSDLRAVAERELEAIKREGWAVVETIKKGRFRRSQGLRPVWERTPWAKEREALREHGGPTVRTEEEAELKRRVLEEFLQGAAPAGGQWVNDEVND